MKVALIGQQDFGKAVMEAFLELGDEVVGVFTAPEKEGAKPDALRVAAQGRGIKLFQLPNLTSDAAKEALKSVNADIGIMAYVLQFAPQDLVNIPKYGTIQYHPSLLPKYRGPRSINWPIICGEAETGIVEHRVGGDGPDETNFDLGAEPMRNRRGGIQQAVEVSGAVERRLNPADRHDRSSAWQISRDSNTDEGLGQ